jgi:hypothetical protein
VNLWLGEFGRYGVLEGELGKEKERSVAAHLCAKMYFCVPRNRFVVIPGV